MGLGQREADGAPNAVTRVTLVERRGGWARYRVEPQTGQRHQLRVQMAALGPPIRFDAFYPEVLRGPDEADDMARPLQLLARTLAFDDPITGEARRFESQRVLEGLRH